MSSSEWQGTQIQALCSAAVDSGSSGLASEAPESLGAYAVLYSDDSTLLIASLLLHSDCR